jgi:hypothetical protein
MIVAILGSRAGMFMTWSKVILSYSRESVQINEFENSQSSSMELMLAPFSREEVQQDMPKGESGFSEREKGMRKASGRFE